jgi:hypothetical protein
MQVNGFAESVRGNERVRHECEGPNYRRPPHNLEVEQALLGAILINNEAMARVSSFLDAEHFYDPLHQRIYGVLGKLIQAGKQATPITLRTFFESAEPIDPGLTVPQYLGRLAVNATTIINAAEYGRTIYDLATRRALIVIGEDIINAAYDTSSDTSADKLLGELADRCGKLLDATPGGLIPIALDELFGREFPPRAFVLSNLLSERGLAMVYAWRGLGKTWFALGLGHAVASGGKFLRWKAERPRRVMHVCGEMLAEDLRDRLLRITGGDGSSLPAPAYYRVLSADMHENGLPDLASRDGQAALERVLGKTELLILDNVSTLFRSGVENEAESWLPVQDWLLRLRRKGVAVVIIHHAGKNKAQRGSSKREDVLDLTLHLRAPEDYDPTEDARFEVHFEKGRGLTGTAKEPFEVKLETRDGKAMWTVRELEDVRHAEMVKLADEGCSLQAIAKQLGMSKSAVHRALQKVRSAA